MRGFTLTCNECGHAKKTWGPWAFSLDKNGNRKRISAHGRRRRPIDGYESRRYCRDCRKTRLMIEPYPLVGEPHCPKCGSSNLIYSLPENEKLLCPNCERGYLEVTMRWIT